ncbi:cadmium-translocating P-type ATPase [bacterium]|nr:cadmium-translocating P-type ATPase [bacterium]
MRHQAYTTDMEKAEPVSLKVDGMRCAACVSHVEQALRLVPGVDEASVNLATGRALVKGTVKDPVQLEDAIEKAGYHATLLNTQSLVDQLAQLEADRRQEATLHGRRVGLCAIIAVTMMLVPWWNRHPVGEMISLGLAIILQATVGLPFYVGAWRRLREGSADMDTLVAVGTSAALGYSIASAIIDIHSHGYAHDSVMVLGLVTLGKWLELRSRNSAGQAIHELLRLVPNTATRVVGNKFETVSADQIMVRDTLLIRPGESFPVDGTVVNGSSTVDQSMLTGESLPVERTIGQAVSAGTVNLTGVLYVLADKVGSDTVLAGIIKLVDQAQSSKPAIARLADRVAARFVPIVLVLSLMTWIGHSFWSGDSGSAWRAAVSVLVVACPCAMGLATPTAVMVATGIGAKMGAFFRHAQGIEEASRVDTIFFDKTGTITLGKPHVVAIERTSSLSIEEILRWSAAAEQTSQHPWAQAIVTHAIERGISFPMPTHSREVAGAGVVAQVAGKEVVVGKRSLLESLIHSIPMGHDDGIFLAIDREWMGRILLADQPRPSSRSVIEQLHHLGMEVQLLTGDSESVAQNVAELVGIPAEHVHASLSPAEKEQRVQQSRAAGKHVAMVGDGINDAPALAAANVGIAMGQGTDVAKQAGDIVLSSPDLMVLVRTVSLCRATVAKIKQNLFWAFGYNAILIPLAAAGYLSPTLSAAAMAASSISVVANSLTLRWRWWDRS